MQMLYDANNRNNGSIEIVAETRNLLRSDWKRKIKPGDSAPFFFFLIFIVKFHFFFF